MFQLINLLLILINNLNISREGSYVIWLAKYFDSLTLSFILTYLYTKLMYSTFNAKYVSETQVAVKPNIPKKLMKKPVSTFLVVAIKPPSTPPCNGPQPKYIPQPMIPKYQTSKKKNKIKYYKNYRFNFFPFQLQVL